VGQRHRREVGKGSVVVDLAIDDQAAMAVVGVRAEAHIGHHQESLAVGVLESRNGFGDKIVFGRRSTPIGRLDAFVRYTEEQARADPKVEVATDGFKQTVNGLVVDAWHGSDWLRDAFPRDHEMGLYEHPGIDPGFGNEITYRR
jgi:hypothetical protein